MTNSFVLQSTGDRSDRKHDIELLLNQYGICILANGSFFVSGIQMPHGSTLQGVGECSEIVLMDQVEEGYAVRMGSSCRVQNLTLKGSDQAFTRDMEVGKRHGIGFVGTASKENRKEPQPQYGFVEGLHIYNFSGGGITCWKTGYSSLSAISAMHCRIHNCGVGINVPHFSEYHKFTNIFCNRNHYGCINNGGNNVFTACAFDGNTVAFLMDNSQGTAINNTHGSVVACTFNHTDSNQGIGIHILNTKNGYVFSGCQLFFSKIVVENSSGIHFANLNAGKNETIQVKGGGPVCFFGSSFTNQPTILAEDGAKVIFRNCFTRATGEEIPPKEA